MNFNVINLSPPTPTIVGNIGGSREKASSTAHQHFLDFLIDKGIISANDDEPATSGDASTLIKNLISSYPDQEQIGSLFCNEDFIEQFGNWLVYNCEKYTKAGGHMASGTVLDQLSILKAINFHYFKDKARTLFQCETASAQNANVAWYASLRKRLESKCGLRDLKVFGKLNEGEKKYAIGRKLLRQMARVDFKINTRDSISDLTRRGTVFNNAGRKVKQIKELFQFFS